MSTDPVSLNGTDPTRERVGVVLGSQDSTPLEFWIGADAGQSIELDDLIVCSVETPSGEHVDFYGVVDLVRKRYEGTQFDGDAFRVEAGTLPAETSYAAHVHVTRIEPERYIPPHPGSAVRIAKGEADLRKALYFDNMERKLPIGLTRGGDVLYANLDFLNGARGAHASISGVSGVATKTTYAMFLLYALFHSDALGADAANTKAVVINVKGEDLLWLDHDNRQLKPEHRELYAALGLPVGPFRDVGIYAPVHPGQAGVVPHTGSRATGVRPYLWTPREFARERLLPFSFADTQDARSQIGYGVEQVTNFLARLAEAGTATDPWLEAGGQQLKTLWDIREYLERSGELAELITNAATRDAFLRRFGAACSRMGHLVRTVDAIERSIKWQDHQVTVVDIHTLHEIGKMFVVGVLLKRMMAEKEQQGTDRPLVFVVLDEQNKYAPRDGWSPIKDVVLDIAERGRSFGISLFGAQQTASEVARRVLANASLKVVGRLDVAEAEHPEYGFLSPVARRRAAFLQPGAMIVSQPEIPSPLLVRFPFPAWATRMSEIPVGSITGRDPFERFK
jgi:DNA helicase HerA-like ATPase